MEYLDLTHTVTVVVVAQSPTVRATVTAAPWVQPRRCRHTPPLQCVKPADSLSVETPTAITCCMAVALPAPGRT